MNADPYAIYQTTLDILTQAILKRDEATWERHMQLPHIMSTSDGRLVHETRDDLIAGLRDYTDALNRIGVTTIRRTCDTARRLKEDLIVGFHTTKMFGADDRPFPAYPVRWVLHLHDGVWKVAKSEAAVADLDWDGIPHRQMAQFHFGECDDDQARCALAQLILDRIDSVYLAGDFTGWRESVHLPLAFDTRSGEGVIATETALREDFELYQQEFKIHQVTEMARVVKSARMINDETMHVTYRVHILSGARYVVPAWDGAMVFSRVADQWRISKLSGALGHLNWKTDAELWG